MAKKETKKTTVTQETKRVIKTPTYKSFRLSKPIKRNGPPLLSSWQLVKTSFDALWRHKKILGGVLLVYGLLQIILVQGAFSSDFSELKNAADESLGGLQTGVSLWSYMLGTVGQANSAEAGVYQSLLFIIGSLAFIWALRELMADKVIKIRDAYYKGMYPLIPFVLVLLVIGLQTIPAFLGAWIYGAVVANGVAVSFIEQVFWLSIFLIFAVLSFYMICSSLFAMYIVTLPEMTPMVALRSARGLVLHRRWSIVRKIIVLALVILAVGTVIMLPLIMVVPVLAPVIFYACTIIATGFVHTYLYNLYRELLVNE